MLDSTSPGLVAWLVSTAAAATDARSKVARGFAFAKVQFSAVVATCYKQAPSFVAVANDPGFNQATLLEFFRDKHDSSAEPSIELEAEQAEIAWPHGFEIAASADRRMSMSDGRIADN